MGIGEGKTEEEIQIDRMWVREMGFSLVVEEMIKAKKPLVGHNMIYDLIYLYNQFVDDLPPTYLQFVTHFHDLFPHIFDNKVLSATSEYFGRTDLGKVYEKCVYDERIKKAGVKIVFDEDNGFVNYVGSELGSHAHEAAYDAYMTGYCFASIGKFKEGDDGGRDKGGYRSGQRRGRGSGRGGGGHRGAREEEEKKGEEGWSPEKGEVKELTE